MWTRAELKSRAKAGLKRYYWYGLLVSFVAGILGASSGGGGALPSFSGSLGGSYMEGSEVGVSGHVTAYDIGFAMILLSIILAVCAAVFLFSIFVSNVVYVGKCRYFTISSLEQQNAGFEELFGCFKKGRYMNVVKIQFFRGLYEFLWSLLLIIPGIVKHYEYYMVPYLAAEYPDMDRKEVFRLSRQMMAGNKFATWVLELSFIGWYLLGLLACCIGGIFVNPYYEATMAELYLKLREERLGIPRGGVHSPDRDGAVYTQNAEGGGSWQNGPEGNRF
ncbi:MAG TPA: DUF975 family protein [Candidatus Cottocaccamicrobium excrementipullorum]|nr:DUF975 family protein [Candidatus Cottocaccamicrobium excrementipullorum]